MIMRTIAMRGGPIHGRLMSVPEEAINGGFAVYSECPKHGEWADCFCCDELIYGYWDKTLYPHKEYTFELAE